MNRLILLFALISAGKLPAQWISDSPQIVALQDTWGNLRPRMALDASASPMVIWSRPSDHTVMFSRRDAGVFSNPVQVSEENLHILSYDWYGPEISSAGNHVYVVYKEMSEESGPIHLVHSSNGGLDWDASVIVDSSSAVAARMPAIAADNDGKVYIAYMLEDIQAGISEWVMVKSTDYGVTFGDMIHLTADNSSAVCDCCPASLAVSDNHVAFLYRNNQDNLRDIRAVVSEDYGESFTAYADMDDMNWILGACPSTGPSAFWNGTQLQSAWMSAASGDSRIYFSAVPVSDLSALDQQLVHLAPSNESQNYPSIDGNDLVSGIAGELLISGQRNIFVSISEDDFQSEFYAVLTSDEPGNQVRPHMKFDGVGFHLVYSDNGGDAVSYRYITQGNAISEAHTGKLIAYPQPAQDRVRITLPEIEKVSSVEIRDIYGRLCSGYFETMTEREVLVYLGDLTSGTYMIQVRCEDSVYSSTIIKD